MFKIIFRYFLSYDVKIFLNLNENKLFLSGKLGNCFLYVPKYYLFYSINNNLYFLFVMKRYFVSFVKHYIYMFNRVFKVYFFRVKLRGLGYYIKKLSERLYKIFIAYNHYYYFYVPYNVYIRRRGREFFFICNNKSLLNDLFTHLLHLKKLDYYDKTNSFMIKNRVIFLKKRK
jgi:hypothetical protein